MTFDSEPKGFDARTVRPLLDALLTKEKKVVHPNPRGIPRREGYSNESINHVRAVTFRLFDAAWRAELIESNPVARIRAPTRREIQKPRMILTDDEVGRFISCKEVDLELRMASLVARCEGGMRTGDLLAWDWSMIDLVNFAECIVPRGKTQTPQPLAVPPTLAPFLRAWWERAGSPENGAVFPARKGKNAGKPKGRRGYTFAKRLRKALFEAGIHRLQPIEVPATSPGTRSDLGRKAQGTKPAPNPADPLFFETATTLPVDFHSFRRAFNTALAEVGVNVQTAMALAAHSHAKTHMRYVMKTTAMRTIPAAALPALPTGFGVQSSQQEPLPPADSEVQSSRPVTIAYMAQKNPESCRRAREDSNL